MSAKKRECEGEGETILMEGFQNDAHTARISGSVENDRNQPPCHQLRTLPQYFIKKEEKKKKRKEEKKEKKKRCAH